jgi:aspartate carbamoyltransferase catalytic subunit
LKGRDVLHIGDFKKEEILDLLSLAKSIKKTPPGRILEGKVMASCFFEPSTRTRLSFESAMKRLGGEVIGFSEPSSTSTKKGESLSDSMRVIGGYADVIVMRHPQEGSALEAASATKTPLINAGDGSNEHPTQTLIDLFTIQEAHGKLEGLNIVLVGDLKYGRASRSLALALRHFNARLFFVSPPSLAMPQEVCEQLREAGISFSSHREIEEVIGLADVLYMTRIQEERFPDNKEYEKVKNCFHLTPEILKKGKASLRVLHPLPRVSEISTDCDLLPQALYFTQAENGLFVRQALLKLLLEVPK